MEFTITCPIDGAIEVSLEDIDNVVLRESDRADITFVCPHCGTEVTVTAVVPSFLLAAIEALADEPESPDIQNLVVLSSDVEGDDATVLAEALELDVEDDDPLLDAYCEYFRRQLGSIRYIEDALNEIDSAI